MADLKKCFPKPNRRIWIFGVRASGSTQSAAYSQAMALYAVKLSEKLDELNAFHAQDCPVSCRQKKIIIPPLLNAKTRYYGNDPQGPTVVTIHAALTGRVMCVRDRIEESVTREQYLTEPPEED